MTLKNHLIDLAVGTIAGVFSTLIINNLGIIGVLVQRFWPAFPLSYLIIWGGVFVIVAGVGYWLSGVTRGALFRHTMRVRVLNFLKLWNELANVHGTQQEQMVTSKLIILYPRIGWYIRMNARVSYRPAFSNTYIQDYDFIGDFLGQGPSAVGYTFQQAWEMGRKLLLAALGSLGYTP